MQSQNNITEKKCGKESCACSNEAADKTKPIEPTSSMREDDNSQTPKKDPTRFGDWEVKGRAIDF